MVLKKKSPMLTLVKIISITLISTFKFLLSSSLCKIKAEPYWEYSGWIECLLFETAGISSQYDLKAKSGLGRDLEISEYSVRELELYKIQTYTSWGPGRELAILDGRPRRPEHLFGDLATWRMSWFQWASQGSCLCGDLENRVQQWSWVRGQVL